jgi:hypothetical protein
MIKKVWEVKTQLEDLYLNFEDRHNELLRLLDDIDCISPEDHEKTKSILHEYLSEIEKVKGTFLMMKSVHTKIQSTFNDTRLLKKRRLATLQSKMVNYDDDDLDKLDDLPF